MAGALGAVLRQVATMLGLGAGATYVIEANDELRDAVLSVSQKALQAVTGRLGEGGGGGGRLGYGGDDRMLQALAQQMGTLSGEMGRLASRPVTVVASNSRDGGSSLTYLVVPLVGGMVYLRLKGYTLEDFKYVSRKGFSEGLSRVKDAMNNVKEQLELSIEHLTGRVNEGLAEQRMLRNDMLEAKNHMRRLEGLVMDVEGRLQSKLDANGDKLDYAVNGIGLLVNVVGEVCASRGVQAHMLDGFRQQQLPAPGSHAPPLMSPRSPGLGQIESLAKSNHGSPSPSPRIRTNRASVEASSVEGLASLAGNPLASFMRS